MRKSRFTETQIIAILHEADSGVPVTEVCRKYGICTNTFYNWKKKYGGPDSSPKCNSQLLSVVQLQSNQGGSAAALAQTMAGLPKSRSHSCYPITCIERFCSDRSLSSRR